MFVYLSVCGRLEQNREGVGEEVGQRRVQGGGPGSRCGVVLL